MPLTTIPPKDLAYLLHHSLYGGVHSNPAKCEKYNTLTCPACGQVHRPCPATN